MPSNPKAFPYVYSWKSKTEPHCGGLFDSTHHHHQSKIACTFAGICLAPRCMSVRSWSMLHENYQSNAARSCYTARYAAIEFKLHAAQSDALQNAEARDRGTRRSVAVNLVNPMPCNFCHPPILLEMDGKDHAKLEVYQIIGFALPHYSGQ